MDLSTPRKYKWDNTLEIYDSEMGRANVFTLVWRDSSHNGNWSSGGNIDVQLLRADKSSGINQLPPLELDFQVIFNQVVLYYLLDGISGLPRTNVQSDCIQERVRFYFTDDFDFLEASDSE